MHYYYLQLNITEIVLSPSEEIESTQIPTAISQGELIENFILSIVRLKLCCVNNILQSLFHLFLPKMNRTLTEPTESSTNVSSRMNSASFVVCVTGFGS